jgi:protein-disulfide isomerase
MSTNQGSLRPDVSDGDHVLGIADAPVTLLEYGDYECPYCYRAHPIIATLRGRLGDRLRFVFRNFPLTEIHPHALHAAIAAESVAASAGAERFWQMHGAIYEHQQDSPDALDDGHLLGYAKAVGADPATVKRDLESSRFVERVRADLMSGVRSGVNGTPTFFINRVRFDGDWTNVTEFAAALEEAARELSPRA